MQSELKEINLQRRSGTGDSGVTIKDQPTRIRITGTGTSLLGHLLGHVLGLCESTAMGVFANHISEQVSRHAAKILLY